MQNYLEGDIEEAENRRFALLLVQLSEFYRFGIGVDRDSAISKRYLKLAAQRGAVEARKFCLILSEVSDDPKYRLETAEKISWALDCLSIRLPPAVCEKLERSLLDLKDQEAVAGLLGHTISQTMGTVLTLRQGLPDVGHVLASLFQDDHVTLEEVIQNVQAEQGIAAVRSMLADYLQYAGRLGMHAVLRFILLHESFDLECVQLRDTLIECVRKGDVQGLLIFMECGVDVETLLDNHELHNASLVGSDIMLHLELIMGRRKERGITKVEEDTPTQSLHLPIPNSSENAVIMTPKNGTLLHGTIMGNNWEGFLHLDDKRNCGPRTGIRRQNSPALCNHYWPPIIRHRTTIDGSSMQVGG